MKTTAYLLEWSARGLRAVYMDVSYPAARVTRLAGLNKHSIYMKLSYPASRSICFEMGNFHPPNYKIV